MQHYFAVVDSVYSFIEKENGQPISADLVLNLDETGHDPSVISRSYVVGKSSSRNSSVTSAPAGIRISKVTTISAAGQLCAEFYMLKGERRREGFTDEWLVKQGLPSGSTIFMTPEAGLNTETWEKVCTCAYLLVCLRFASVCVLLAFLLCEKHMSYTGASFSIRLCHFCARTSAHPPLHSKPIPTCGPFFSWIACDVSSGPQYISAAQNQGNPVTHRMQHRHSTSGSSVRRKRTNQKTAGCGFALTRRLRWTSGLSSHLLFRQHLKQ